MKNLTPILASVAVAAALLIGSTASALQVLNTQLLRAPRTDHPLICPLFMELPYECADGNTSIPDPSDACHNHQYCPDSSSELHCKPTNAMPIECEDGSQAQPVLDSRHCVTSFTCPVKGFTPPASCKAWNDGCNVCSRETPNGKVMCTMRACFAPAMNPSIASTTLSLDAGFAAGKGSCTQYFGDAPAHECTTPQIMCIRGFVKKSDGTDGNGCLKQKCVPAPTLPETGGLGGATTSLPISCPTDVQRCSDGSTVHRFAPLCNFADCPRGAHVAH